MDFIETASAGLSAAQIILLTYLALTTRSIDLRLAKVEGIVSKMLGRVQHLSVKAGLQELEVD